MEININEDVTIRTDEEFSKNIPYKVVPEIIYKGFIFKQILNIDFFEDYFNHRRTEYLQIFYCTCNDFRLCKFRKSCLENNSIKKNCPYSNMSQFNIQRRHSKNYNNAAELIRIAKIFINEKLYEYATWIIHNKDTVISKELFEEMRNIPELDPKYFSESYNKYAFKRTLIENENKIYKQEPYDLYTLDKAMPKFIKSYLQMANDYLTDLNDLISGEAFGAVSAKLSNLRRKYKNKRILIPIFEYIIIWVQNYECPIIAPITLFNKYYNIGDICIKNEMVSIKKECLDDVMSYIRSLSNDVYSLVLERYDLKEHEQPVTEEDIKKLIF